MSPEHDPVLLICLACLHPSGGNISVITPDLSLLYSSQKRESRKESSESCVRKEMRQRAGELRCYRADSLLAEGKCETSRWSCPQEGTKARLLSSSCTGPQTQINAPTKLQTHLCSDFFFNTRHFPFLTRKRKVPRNSLSIFNIHIYSVVV